MYAIVQLGSFQYKVSEGDTIEAQLMDGKENSNIILNQVLLLDDGSSVKIGQPFLKNVKITAKIVRRHLADKVISFKYRRRKNSSWKKGHRQKLITLNITKIQTEK